MLNKTDKHILATLYSCDMTGREPMEMMSCTLLPSEIRSRLDRLSEKRLAAGTLLTKAGRKSIRVVLTGGVFDIIHPGHARMLADAKALGDMLVVVVARDGVSRRMKKALRHTEGERRALAGSLETVDACVTGQHDMFGTVRDVRPDIIALGYDQIHDEKDVKNGCNDIGVDVDVVRLGSKMPDMSSSNVRKEELDGL